MISEIEQQTSDIDWFFTNGRHIAFVASGGGKLPLSISSSFDTSIIAAHCKMLYSVSTVVINPNLNKIVPDFDERYLADFKEMAKKGFFAFDKTVLSNFSELNYHLVASPVIPLSLSDLEPDIAQMIMKTSFYGPVGDRINISDFDL
ncbi:hypothetical protein [Mucilaginibacter sp.]|uniref:hypothetical protein n=1 Tax=Mucilaginibacter sp. TaxID=1882438 RepID=UPI0032637D21